MGANSVSPNGNGRRGDRNGLAVKDSRRPGPPGPVNPAVGRSGSGWCLGTRPRRTGPGGHMAWLRDQEGAGGARLNACPTQADRRGRPRRVSAACSAEAGARGVRRRGHAAVRQGGPPMRRIPAAPLHPVLTGERKARQQPVGALRDFPGTSGRINRRERETAGRSFAQVSDQMPLIAAGHRAGRPLPRHLICGTRRLCTERHQPSALHRHTQP